MAHKIDAITSEPYSDNSNYDCLKKYVWHFENVAVYIPLL